LTGLIHLRGRNSDLVVDLTTGAPTVVHWGAPLGDIDTTTLRAALDRPLVFGSADVVAPVTVVPEHGSGFTGRPGLRGHRAGGTAWSPRFVPVDHEVTDRRLTVTARDDAAELTLTVTFEVDHALVVWAELTNTATKLKGVTK
jgi:alpha-galactosidase